MTYNMNERKINALDVNCIGRAQRRVLRAYARLLTWRAVAKEYSLNVRYVYELGAHSIIPSDPDIRAVLGLPRHLPSERNPRGKREKVGIGKEGWESVYLRKVKK